MPHFPSLVWEQLRLRTSTPMWKSAHPIGISYADGFRYLPDGSVYWMLLGVVEA